MARKWCSVRGLLLGAAHWVGADALCRRRNRRKAAIICYHGVCDDAFVARPEHNPLHTPAGLFRRQIDHLRRHRYRFVTMSELASLLTGPGPLPEGLVSLTFDDGYRNVLRNAYPIMRDAGARGCIYVVSDLVGTGRMVWADWIEAALRGFAGERFEFDFEGGRRSFPTATAGQRERAAFEVKRLLRSVDDPQRRLHLERFEQALRPAVPREYELADWDELGALDPAVLQVGSHTGTHPSLAKVSRDDVLDREIGGSKRTIEARLGRAVEHFCYPRSSFDERVTACVRRHGYATAVTLRYGFNDRSADLLALRRVGGAGTFSDFRANVSGLFSLYLSARGR